MQNGLRLAKWLVVAISLGLAAELGRDIYSWVKETLSSMDTATIWQRASQDLLDPSTQHHLLVSLISILFYGLFFFFNGLRKPPIQTILFPAVASGISSVLVQSLNHFQFGEGHEISIHFVTGGILSAIFFFALGSVTVFWFVRYIYRTRVPPE